jgi:hypothetical protein
MRKKEEAGWLDPSPTERHEELNSGLSGFYDSLHPS